MASQFSLRVWTLEGEPCFSERSHTQDYGSSVNWDQQAISEGVGDMKLVGEGDWR